MSQTDEIMFANRTIENTWESMIVVHDIRVADLRSGVLELDTGQTINATKSASDRQCFDQQGSISERLGVAAANLGVPQEENQITESNVLRLEEIHRVGEVIANRLRTHGLDSIGTVAAADHDELMQVTGIGEVRAQEIRQSAKQLIDTVC